MLRSGERIAAICQLGSDETGGKVRPGALRHDVLEWSESASSGEQFREALGLWKRNGTPGLSVAARERFYDAMDEADGKVELACELANIAPEVIYALRERKNKCYDAEFAERVNHLEGRRMSTLRENLLDAAAEPGIKGARLAAAVLASSMPTLHGVTQEVKHVGEVVLQHALAPEVVAASAERTRKLMLGRVEQTLPAGVDDANVLDITPRVRDRERAEA